MREDLLGLWKALGGAPQSGQAMSLLPVGDRMSTWKLLRHHNIAATATLVVLYFTKILIHGLEIK